jgi:hypothetical protein
MEIIQENEGTVNDIMKELTEVFELDTYNNGGAYPDKTIFKKLIEIKNKLNVINSPALYTNLANELKKTSWAQNLGKTMNEYKGFEELEKALMKQ